jgi:hypothetical protein
MSVLPNRQLRVCADMKDRWWDVADDDRKARVSKRPQHRGLLVALGKQQEVPPVTVILVTGMSGTGKSSVLHWLERRGYRVVDTDVGNWIEDRTDVLR